MMRGKRSLRDSQPPSPSGSEDDEARSPVSKDGDLTTGLETPPFARGRKSEVVSNTEEEDETMEVVR